MAQAVKIKKTILLQLKRNGDSVEILGRLRKGYWYIKIAAMLAYMPTLSKPSRSDGKP
jgi:hypothetical protein